ncbi:MAG: SUMF1/EgtB/PvdO family nonheme iron enzyme [Armatimonadota bacterium]
MVRIYVAAAIAVIMTCVGVRAHSDVFNMPNGLTSLEMVLVGDSGNAPDVRNGHGAVNYTYRMGKFEITAGQYTDFLNAKAVSDPYGLYNTDMAKVNVYGCNICRSGDSGSYTYSIDSDWANRPVNYVSYWDACRFVNWLNNGQGSGDTETGAYTLNGYNGNDGRTIARNSEAKWFLPTQDEWYKAAYYKGNGNDAGYWSYPTQSDSAPSNQLVTPDDGNNANFSIIDSDGYHDAIGYPYYRTNVGEFENSASAYGTFDQGGNVWEYNEALIISDNIAFRSNCGGSFLYSSSALNAMDGSYSLSPNEEILECGFRVVEAVPEPPTVISIVVGLGLFVFWGFRRLIQKHTRPASI